MELNIEMFKYSYKICFANGNEFVVVKVRKPHSANPSIYVKSINPKAKPIIIKFNVFRNWENMVRILNQDNNTIWYRE